MLKLFQTDVRLSPMNWVQMRFGPAAMKYRSAKWTPDYTSSGLQNAADDDRHRRPADSQQPGKPEECQTW